MTTINYTTEYEKQLVSEIHRIIKDDPEKAPGALYSPKELLLVIFPQKEEPEIVLWEEEQEEEEQVHEESHDAPSLDMRKAAYKYYGELQKAVDDKAQGLGSQDPDGRSDSSASYYTDSNYHTQFKPYLQSWTGPFYNNEYGFSFNKRLVKNINTAIELGLRSSFRDELTFVRIVQTNPEPAPSHNDPTDYPFYAKALLGLGVVVSCGLLITVNEVVKACQEKPSKGIVDMGFGLMGGGAGFALSYFLALGAIGLTLTTAGGALLVFASIAVGSALCSFAFNKASDKYIFRPTDAEQKNDDIFYRDPNDVDITSNCARIHNEYTFFWTDAGILQNSLKKEIQNSRDLSSMTQPMCCKIF